jgi:hypothetical protein
LNGFKRIWSNIQYVSPINVHKIWCKVLSENCELWIMAKS